jgi:hypothetical protein
MAAMILPIALAGLVALPRDAAPDLFVLRILCRAHALAGDCGSAGGISSAAAMVIVDTTALAIMVSNDLIFPAVLRSGAAEVGNGHVGRQMMGVRRLAIIAVIGASLSWALLCLHAVRWRRSV